MLITWLSTISRVPFSSRPSPSPNITARQTDTTVGWKSYASAGGGFSLKYPPTWTYTEWTYTLQHQQEGGGYREYKMYSTDFKESMAEASRSGRIFGWFRISFATSPEVNARSVEEFKNSEFSPWDRDKLSWRTVNIGTTRARELHHGQCFSHDCLDVLLKRGSTIFQLSIPERSSDEYRKSIFDLMLTTFRLN